MPLTLPRESAREDPGLLWLRVLEPSGAWLEEVPLRFVANRGGVEVMAPRDALPRWARALTGGASAIWRIGGRSILGLAEPVDDLAESAALLDRFSSVFGEAEVRRWFPSGAKGYHLCEPTDVPPDYPAQVEGYFDRLAAGYDAMVDRNPLDRELRSISGAALQRAFRPGERVLEIGCGTGLETLPLARRGVHVLATDVSAEMLKQLDYKARSEGLSSFIETRRMSARALPSLWRELPPGSFDGAFSDFGALNCEPDVAGLPAAFHGLMRPGGILVLGVWNRFCAAEAILSLATLKPRRAVSRFEDPVPAGSSRFGVPVYPRAAGELLDGFEPFFELETLTGLPVFVPPYDFAEGFASSGALLPLLRRLDAAFASRFPFNRFGDHTLVEMRRRP